MSEDNSEFDNFQLDISDENFRIFVPDRTYKLTTFPITEDIYDPLQVVHPGFVGQRVDGKISWPNDRVTESRRSRKVEQYMNFQDFSGIDETNKDLLSTLMKDIFSKTGDFWEPKLCQECALRMLNSITSGEVELPPNYIAAWVYKINHSWLEIWIEGLSEPVIFDPTGLDARPWSSSANMYEPYFGLRSKAPAHLISQYNYSTHIQRIFSNKPHVAVKRYTDWKTDVVTISEIPRRESDSREYDDKIDGIYLNGIKPHWMKNIHDRDEL